MPNDPLVEDWETPSSLNVADFITAIVFYGFARSGLPEITEPLQMAGKEHNKMQQTEARGGELEKVILLKKSLEHFRGFMNSYMGNGWEASTGERLSFRERPVSRPLPGQPLLGNPVSIGKSLGGGFIAHQQRVQAAIEAAGVDPVRARWEVSTSRTPLAYAKIEVFETDYEQLRVLFLDGHIVNQLPHERPKIGTALKEFEQFISQTAAKRDDKAGQRQQKTSGNKKLKESDPDQYVYRLAKAEEGIEIYKARRGERFKKTWSDVCKQIGWTHGCDESGIKLFEYARKDYAALQSSDPEGWLVRVKTFREQEKREKEKKKM